VPWLVLSGSGPLKGMQAGLLPAAPAAASTAFPGPPITAAAVPARGASAVVLLPAQVLELLLLLLLLAACEAA